MGPPGAPFGASWATFWSLLGPLGAPLGRHPKKEQKSTPKMTVLGSPTGSKMGPKTDQSRTRNRTSKKYLFNTVLGASWGDLGAFSVPSRGHRTYFPSSGAQNSKNHIFLKKSCLGPMFGQLGRPKGPKREPKGTQKSTPKQLNK